MPKDNVVAASVHVLTSERDRNEEAEMQKAGSGKLIVGSGFSRDAFR